MHALSHYVIILHIFMPSIDSFLKSPSTDKKPATPSFLGGSPGGLGILVKLYYLPPLVRDQTAMSMISSPSLPTTSSFPTASPGVIPFPSTIACRPVLIPYSTELSAYISATSSVNPSFHISPFGTILGVTFNTPLSTSVGRASLLMVRIMILSLYMKVIYHLHHLRSLIG